MYVLENKQTKDLFACVSFWATVDLNSLVLHLKKNDNNGIYIYNVCCICAFVWILFYT